MSRMSDLSDKSDKSEFPANAGRGRGVQNEGMEVSRMFIKLKSVVQQNPLLSRKCFASGCPE